MFKETVMVFSCSIKYQSAISKSLAMKISHKSLTHLRYMLAMCEVINLKISSQYFQTRILQWMQLEYHCDSSTNEKMICLENNNNNIIIMMKILPVLLFAGSLP